MNVNQFLRVSAFSVLGSILVMPLTGNISRADDSSSSSSDSSSSDSSSTYSSSDSSSSDSSSDSSSSDSSSSSSSSSSSPSCPGYNSTLQQDWETAVNVIPVKVQSKKDEQYGVVGAALKSKFSGYSCDDGCTAKMGAIKFDHEAKTQGDRPERKLVTEKDNDWTYQGKDGNESDALRIVQSTSGSGRIYAANEAHDNFLKAACNSGEQKRVVIDWSGPIACQKEFSYTYMETGWMCYQSYDYEAVCVPEWALYTVRTKGQAPVGCF